MLRLIFIILILRALFRRPRYWGGWGYHRPPMGCWHHGPWGWDGPYGWY